MLAKKAVPKFLLSFVGVVFTQSKMSQVTEVFIRSTFLISKFVAKKINQIYI
jgi:hypothetical protein